MWFFYKYLYAWLHLYAYFYFLSDNDNYFSVSQLTKKEDQPDKSILFIPNFHKININYFINDIFSIRPNSKNSIKNKSMHTGVIMHTNTYRKITYIFMLTLYAAYIIF